MAVVGSKCGFLWCIWVLVYSAGLASAQEQVACYGPGSIAASVILTFVFTALLLAGGFFLWKKYRNKKGKIQTAHIRIQKGLVESWDCISKTNNKK